MWQWLEKKFLKKRPSLLGIHLLHSSPATLRNFEQRTQESYLKNVIVYRAINLISHNLASVPWILKEEEKIISNHPLVTLLERPNPLQSQRAFLEALVGYLMLSGNGYIERIYAGNEEELHLLRPDRLTVLPSQTSIPRGYQYEVNGMQRIIPVDPILGTAPFLHLKFFHPLHDWEGLSPLQAAQSAIAQHNAVSEHNLSLLENGGRPSGALLVKQGEGATPLTSEQRETLREDLRAAYEGTANAGRITLLEGDMEWKEMGLSPKDLDFLSGKYLSAREIAQAFGVPPMLVGVPGDATFANYREARFHLWEDTILPLLNTIIAELNRWLVRPRYPHLSFTYDIDSISALALRRDPIWERIKEADYLTPNEKRQAVGYGPLETPLEAPLPTTPKSKSKGA